MSTRVVVFGYGELALAALETMQKVGVTPVAVVVPGNRRGADVDLVEEHARSGRLPLLVQPPRAAVAPFLESIREARADVLLVWSYSMLLPPALIALARRSAVNVHGGLLPEYRGGHVMNWAIANGEQETGVTLAHLDAGIDTGPVIAQQRFPISWHDDAASVREKLKVEGKALLERWWPAIERGTAPRTSQDESRARYYRLRTADDGWVDWTRSSIEIHNLVRALVAPWPGAFTTIDGTRVVLRRVEPLDRRAPPEFPGTITRCDETLIGVATGSGEIALRTVELEGREASLADLVGAGLTVGGRLGEPSRRVNDSSRRAQL